MARDEEAYRKACVEIDKLNTAKNWRVLRTRAEAAAAQFPDSADMHASVAHALRQLNELEAGYEWAVRARAIDPNNLFAINRVSLLAVLTGRTEEAFASVDGVLDREVTTAADRQNLAVAISNAIHAASSLQRIPLAVERFTPVIERLDHDDLHFNAACLYALAGDDRVFTHIAKSLAAEKPKTAFDDGDFNAVRSDARFVELLARDWKAEADAMERANKPTRDTLTPEDFLDPDRLRTPAPDDGTHHTRNDELERVIAANLDDGSAYLVYADWLQERSNPLGLVIASSRRCDDARTEGERMLAYVEWASLVHLHAGALFAGLAEYVGRKSRAMWRHGFIRELVFDVGYQWNRDISAPELLAATLRLPSCRFLRTLAIGDVCAREELDYRPIVETLLRAQLRHLRSLAIAPNKFQMSWTHLDATGLAARFPDLETLVLGGGDITLDALDFPQLRRFAIHTGGLSRDAFDAIRTARWQRLEDLEIWFGSVDHGAFDFDPADLQSILEGRGTPKLRRLALRNAEFTDALCTAIVSAPILPRLATLDLSMGTLTDAGAAVLVEHAHVFRHLARLDVDDNALSPDAARSITNMLPCASCASQKADRYVSVGE